MKHWWINTHQVPTTGSCNANYISGTGSLTSCVSTLFPEEAVNEVKRQAMLELQKAVSEAERKAHEMISSERAKMERTVAEAKRQAAEDALSIINQQEDSSEVGITHKRCVPNLSNSSRQLSLRSCCLVVIYYMANINYFTVYREITYRILIKVNEDSITLVFHNPFLLTVSFLTV